MDKFKIYMDYVGVLDATEEDVKKEIEVFLDHPHHIKHLVLEWTEDDYMCSTRSIPEVVENATHYKGYYEKGSFEYKGYKITHRYPDEWLIDDVAENRYAIYETVGEVKAFIDGLETMEYIIRDKKGKL